MWYAIQVYTGKEQETIGLCESCIGEDYKFINPQMERMRRYRGKWHKERMVMFPGYVFIDTEDITGFCAGIVKVPRLMKVLGADNKPIPIKQHEVDVLKRLVNDEYILTFSKGIKTGDRLVVGSGSLIGMEALIKKIDRHKRLATIEVPMFGRIVETVVGLEVLIDVHKEA